MKKYILIPVITLLILTAALLTFAETPYYQPPKESDEELVMDMFFHCYYQKFNRPLPITMQILTMKAH